MTAVPIMQQARTAVREGRLVDARSLLRQAIHEDPTNHAAWLLLARATPNEKVAAQYIDRARQLQPDSPLVKRAEDDLVSGRRTTPKRRVFSWRLALPLIGIALILGLLTSKVSEGAWQQIIPPQNDGAEVVLAAAESTQGESEQTSQTAAETMPTASSVEEAQFPVKSAPAASLREIRSAEVPGEASDEAQDTIFQPLVAAGSEQALPAAIMRGIETSASSNVEEELIAETDAGANASQEEAIDENSASEAGGELETVGDVEIEEVTTDAADDELDAEVEEESQDLAAVESETPAEEETAAYDTVEPALGERWIDVNLTTQTLTAYEGETPVLYSTISSGLWQFPTVTGEFRTWMKYDTQNMTGYHLGYNYEIPDVPYVMYFFEDYAIHGAYWHNSFGTPMSHGCVNMNVVDAGWLYDWAPIGTHVSVHH